MTCKLMDSLDTKSLYTNILVNKCCNFLKPKSSKNQELTIPCNKIKLVLTYENLSFPILNF